MTEVDEKLRAVGAMWGGADYDRLARALGSVHDRLVSALEPQRAERWLDLATGTGEVALRAARLGAEVVAVDVSEPLLEQAREKAAAEALDVRFELADVRRVPYEDAAFDVVASCFGVIFPPDHDAVARELGRVCRPGGRLGLTTWVPDEEFESLWAPFVDEPAPDEADEPDVWDDPESIRALLGADFELVVETEEWVLEAESSEALWKLFVSAAPPFKALHDSLEPARREEMHRVFLDAHARYHGDGGVRVPRAYLLVVGRRR